MFMSTANGFLSTNAGFAGHAMAAAPARGLVVRFVTAANFEEELDHIGALLSRFPFIVIDTEYPGTVHRPAPGRREADLLPVERYALVKANVDELPVVQLGITLCDADGNLPVVADVHGHLYERAWQFNFSDFDLLRDRHAPTSVAFLESQGFDFGLARQHGVSSVAFAAKLAAVLSSTRLRGQQLTWAAFGGAYDFAYMVKMLSGGQPLPETWHEFVAQARDLLGGQVFDAKYMADHSGRVDLCVPGLRRVANRLGAPPLIPEPPCLAGPKSYTACLIYKAMRRHLRDQYRGVRRYFSDHDHSSCFDRLIDGFHWVVGFDMC